MLCGNRPQSENVLYKWFDSSGNADENISYQNMFFLMLKNMIILKKVIMLKKNMIILKKMILLKKRRLYESNHCNKEDRCFDYTKEDDYVDDIEYCAINDAKEDDSIESNDHSNKEDYNIEKKITL